MKIRFLFIALMLAFCVLLSAVTFEEGLNAVSDKLVSKLKSPKSDCLSFISVKSGDGASKSFPGLDAYVLSQMIERLQTVKKVKVIEPAKVKEVLETKMPGFKLPADYVNFQAFCEQIFYLTNKSTNVLITGTIVPEADSILISLTLHYPVTTTKINAFSKWIPRDEVSDKLMGVVRPKPVVPAPVQIALPVPDEVLEVEETVEVAASLPEIGGLVWSEDFADYAIGDPLPLWGTNAIILSHTDKRHYLSSQTKEPNNVKVNVKFPKDFVFKFEAIGWENMELSFGDNQDKEYKIQMGGDWNGGWIQLPGNKGNYIKTYPINVYRFEKKGNFIKCFINGEFAQTAAIEGFNDLQFFRMRLPNTAKLTAFSVSVVE